MNRLRGMRCYLAGPMEFAPDNGVGWRKSMTIFLKSLGVIVIDPTNKPPGGPDETVEMRKWLNEQKLKGNYKVVAEHMKKVRAYDLRYVDNCDFEILQVDITQFACGSWEECFTANHQKKPVIVHAEHGIEKLSDWLFGTVPVELLFSKWEHIRWYLDHIDKDEEIDDLNRWRFIDYDWQQDYLTNAYT